MSATGFLDACGFFPAAGGTADFVVSAAITGYQTPASAGAVNGAVYSYRAQSSDMSEWEIGFGAYATGTTTLARTTVVASSTGSKVNFSAPPSVYVTALTADLKNPFLINGIDTPYTVSETHSSNAATFAVKTLGGSDPSASDPVKLTFQDGAGGVVVRTVTSALSITVPSGATLGASNGVPFRVWIVALDNAGSVELGVVKCADASGVMSLDDSAVYSSTGISSSASSAKVIYTAASRSSLYSRIIGHATYEAGLSTAGAWDSSPTRMVVQKSDSPRPGQVVGYSYSFTSSSQTISTTTLTASTLAVSPSLKSPANAVRVGFSSNFQVGGSANYMNARIGRGSSSNLIGTAGVGGSGANYVFSLSGFAFDLPGSTSPTYTVYINGANANSITFNNNAAATMDAMEIMA